MESSLGALATEASKFVTNFKDIISYSTHLLIIVAFFATEVNNFETITASISQHSRYSDWLSSKLACS